MKSVCLIVQNFYDIDARVKRKAEALVAAGYSVDVLALRLPGGKKCSVMNGVNVYTMPLRKRRGSLARYLFEYGAFFVWTLVRLRGMMRSRRYVVIDVNTLPDFLIFAAAFARRRGAKLILDMHELTPEFYVSKYGIARQSWIARLLEFQEKISFDFADHVLTINEPAQRLLEKRGLPRSKSTVIMNTADEARFARGAGSTSNGPVSSGAFVMMYHGTLTKIYGLDLAIEAFDSVHSQMPRAELWILGSGPEQSALADLAERRGLSAKVKLLGQKPSSEIPGWLRQCTVGLLPIRRDVFLDFAFPNKLPECIIAGKPVIISRLNAIQHYFSEEALAYFEPNSVEDLAVTMLRLYQDGDGCNRLAARAMQEYAPISWTVMRQAYLDVMADLIGHRPEAPASPSA